MQSSLDQHSILAVLVFLLVFSDAHQHTDAVHCLLPLLAAVSIYPLFCRLLLYAEELRHCPVPASKGSPTTLPSSSHSSNETDSPVNPSTPECDRLEAPAPQPDRRNRSTKPGPIRLSEYFAQHPPRTPWIPASYAPFCPQSTARSRRGRSRALPPLVIIHIRREKPRRAEPFHFPKPIPRLDDSPAQKAPSRATAAPKLQPSPPVQLPTIRRCEPPVAPPQHQVATSLCRTPTTLSVAPGARPTIASVPITSVPDDMDVDDVGPAPTIVRPKDVFPPLYQTWGLTCAMLKNIHLARSDEFYAMLAYRAEKRPVFQFGGRLEYGAMEVD